MNNYSARQVVERCLAITKDQFPEAVQALVIGGSVGRGEYDEFSDVDLFIWVTETKTTVLMEVATVLSSYLGNVRITRGPVWVDSFGYSFSFLLDPLLVVQLNINDVGASQEHPMRALPALVCFDRSDWFASLQQRAKFLCVDRNAILKNALTLCMFRVLSVWRSLKRGELWFGIQHLGDIRDHILTITRLAEGKLPPGLQVRAPAKAAETQLGESLLHFDRTLPTYSHTGLASALDFSLAYLDAQLHKIAVGLDSDLMRLTDEAVNVIDEVRKDLSEMKLRER